jgi:IS5 family transposase
MRKTIDPQTKLGQVNISQIEFDLRSRDEIPKLLMGLQYIYCTPEIRKQVFRILEEMVPTGTDANTGRPGMLLWKILVLGTLRLNCNWDYDKVKEMADNHFTLRLMLGHSGWEDEYRYPIQTIKDNVSLFTPEILDKINQIAVKAGHNLVKKNETLNARCDSFVVETDVHYPTDINLLFDAMRKVITLLARVCATLGLSEWRQSAHNIRKLKRLYRKAQSLKRFQAKKKERVEQKRERIACAHREYTDAAEAYLEKAKSTLKVLAETNRITAITYDSIKPYIRHAERQIDQTRRRVLKGEHIPHQEKVFSIFEEHTEWISKGKAGVPQELGLKVCVVEDQYGFLLHHLVMRNSTDDKVAVSLIEATRKRFPQLVSCSFDKNFYTPGNRKQLERMLDLVVLPKKGRLSEEEQAVERSEEFVQGRKKHPAVESGINALENHGLDRCLDHGLRSFERYVGLAIVARNIQILGTILWKRENDKIQRDQTRLRKAS